METALERELQRLGAALKTHEVVEGFGFSPLGFRVKCRPGFYKGSRRVTRRVAVRILKRKEGC